MDPIANFVCEEEPHSVAVGSKVVRHFGFFCCGTTFAFLTKTRGAMVRQDPSGNSINTKKELPIPRRCRSEV